MYEYDLSQWKPHVIEGLRQNLLRTLRPNKGNNMNEVPSTIVDPVTGDHFVLTIDDATGEMVKVKLLPTGEFSQDLDDAPAPEGVTIH